MARTHGRLQGSARFAWVRERSFRGLISLAQMPDEKACEVRCTHVVVRPFRPLRSLRLSRILPVRGEDGNLCRLISQRDPTRARCATCWGTQDTRRSSLNRSKNTSGLSIAAVPMRLRNNRAHTTAGVLRSIEGNLLMPQPIAYLAFNGNCADAMRFYERALGGKLETMMRSADAPCAAEVPPEFGGRIMHACLTGICTPATAHRICRMRASRAWR